MGRVLPRKNEFEFDRPIAVTVRLSVRDVVLAEGATGNIAIQHFHADRWELLSTEVDFDNLIARAEVYGLSIFALTIKEPETQPATAALPAPALTVTPTATPTLTPSATPTATPAPTPTATPAAATTPPPGPAAAPIPPATPTLTATPTATMMPTATPRPTLTPTLTPTATPTITPTPTPMATMTPTAAALPAAAITSTPLPTPAGPLIIVLASTVKTGRPVMVEFSGAPGNEMDWIGLYRVTESDEAPTTFRYLKGATEGSMNVIAPAVGRAYEFRMFANWPEGGYVDIATSGTIEVIPPPTATPTATPTPTSTPLPTATPTITPTSTPLPTATPTITPTPSPAPTATPVPPTATPVPPAATPPPPWADVVTIIKAEYDSERERLRVEATSSMGGSVNLTATAFDSTGNVLGGTELD